MKLGRIYTIFLRYLYTTRDPTRIAEFIIWPMIDVGFFGMIALWSGSLTNDSKLLQNFISALILWQVIYRSHFEICVNVLDEFRERNLINLVTTPLKKSEWVSGLMLSGLLKITFTLLFGALLGLIYFNINIFSMGFVIFPFALLCLISGWIIGFFSAGIVVCKGSKLMQLPWIVIMTAAIFSNTLFPVALFPPVLKYISLSMPMSYIFEGMREMLASTTVSGYYWIMATTLSIVYLAVAIKFFLTMFERSRNRGLTRLP